MGLCGSKPQKAAGHTGEHNDGHKDGPQPSKGADARASLQSESQFVRSLGSLDGQSKSFRPSDELGHELAAGALGLPQDIVRFGAPKAPNEEAEGAEIVSRMRTLRALGATGAFACPEVDTLLLAVCEVWSVKVASVTILDSDHVWMCNAQGCGTGGLPWANAMCPWTLLTPQPLALAVGDLGADARFAGNVHHKAGTQSYLTAPLVASNGHRLGAICFTDTKTRTFDAGDCRLMCNMAELAMRELEKHVGLAARLKAEDEELSQVFSKRVRDVDEVADSCVMLVDTSVSGWRLMYANGAWEDWTAAKRSACVGKTLNELLEHVHGDASEDVVYSGLIHQAAELKSFVMPKVRVRPDISGHNSSGGLHCFYIAFKPAALSNLDDDTVSIGVAPGMPMSISPSAARFYFARLYSTPSPPPCTRVTSQVTSFMESANNSGPNAVYRTSAPQRLTASKVLSGAAARLELMSPALAAQELFKGLKASHVLGSGNYGTVWHATWHGTPVALKIVESELEDEDDLKQVTNEQLVGCSLTHVNIVRMLAHTSSLIRGGAIQWGEGLSNTGLRLEESVSTCQASAPSWAQQDGPLNFLPVAGGQAILSGWEEDQPQTLEGAAARLPSDPSTGAVIQQSTSVNVQDGRVLSSGLDMTVGLPPLLQSLDRPAPAGIVTAPAAGDLVSQLQADIAGNCGNGDAAADACGAAEEVSFGTLPIPSSAPTGPPSPVVPSPPPGSGSGQTAAYVAPWWHTIPTDSAAGAPLELSGGTPARSALWPHASVSAVGSGSRSGTPLPSVAEMSGHNAPSPGTGVTSGTGEHAPGRYSSGGLPGLQGASEQNNTTNDPDSIYFPFSLRQWMLLEFCNLGNLTDACDKGWFRVARQPHAPPHMPHVCPAALDVALGLVYLHSKHVVHGDLTGVNVLLASCAHNDTLPGDTRGWVGKLSDFGLSQKMVGAAQVIQACTYGAITHMAPEVLNAGQLGYKGDVYSAGVIMWQMLTGCRPWAGLSHLQVSVRVGVELQSLQWPEELTAEAPAAAEFARIGAWCLAVDPDARPTAEELAAALTSLCSTVCV